MCPMCGEGQRSGAETAHASSLLPLLPLPLLPLLLLPPLLPLPPPLLALHSLLALPPLLALHSALEASIRSISRFGKQWLVWW